MLLHRGDDGAFIFLNEVGDELIGGLYFNAELPHGIGREVAEIPSDDAIRLRLVRSSFSRVRSGRSLRTLRIHSSWICSVHFGRIKSCTASHIMRLRSPAG
jgi:hypothetical protein